MPRNRIQFQARETVLAYSHTALPLVDAMCPGNAPVVFARADPGAQPGPGVLIPGEPWHCFPLPIGGVPRGMCRRDSPGPSVVTDTLGGGWP